MAAKPSLARRSSAGGRVEPRSRLALGRLRAAVTRRRLVRLRVRRTLRRLDDHWGRLRSVAIARGPARASAWRSASASCRAWRQAPAASPVRPCSSTRCDRGWRHSARWRDRCCARSLHLPAAGPSRRLPRGRPGGDPGRFGLDRWPLRLRQPREEPRRQSAGRQAVQRRRRRDRPCGPPPITSRMRDSSRTSSASARAAPSAGSVTVSSHIRVG